MSETHNFYSVLFTFSVSEPLLFTHSHIQNVKDAVVDTEIFDYPIIIYRGRWKEDIPFG